MCGAVLGSQLGNIKYFFKRLSHVLLLVDSLLSRRFDPKLTPPPPRYENVIYPQISEGLSPGIPPKSSLNLNQLNIKCSRLLLSDLRQPWFHFLTFNTTSPSAFWTISSFKWWGGTFHSKAIPSKSGASMSHCQNPIILSLDSIWNLVFVTKASHLYQLQPSWEVP